MIDEFEHYTLFRFIKAVYYLGLAFFIFIVIFFGLAIFSHDWQTSVIVVVIGLSGAYIILNVFRETAIYIVYGRKFTWDWIIRPLEYLNAHYKE